MYPGLHEPVPCVLFNVTGGDEYDRPGDDRPQTSDQLLASDRRDA